MLKNKTLLITGGTGSCEYNYHNAYNFNIEARFTEFVKLLKGDK